MSNIKLSDASAQLDSLSEEEQLALRGSQPAPLAPPPSNEMKIGSSIMLSPAVNQVAGHQAGAGKVGPLVDGAGRFYKPIQDGERGEREIKFYEQFWADQNVPNCIKALFPHFDGRTCIEASDGSGLCDHAVLEDLTHSFHQPSVMDVKMGARTWYQGASAKYIAKCMEKDRETTSEALGFRVSGMQVYDAATGRTWKPHRNWCKLLTADAMEFSLKRFVSSNPTDDTCPDAAFASAVYGGSHGIIQQLAELKTWFETQTNYHFYSSSLLLIYEGNPTVGNSGPQRLASVKLVDFAHVLTGQESLDENFLDGLNSLIGFLTGIVKTVSNS